MLVASVVCNGARWHLDKAALDAGASRSMLVVIGSLGTAGGFLLVGAACRAMGWRAAGLESASPGALLRLPTSERWLLAAAGVSAGLAAWLAAWAMNRYGAESTAFLANLTLVFTVLGGLMASEKLNVAEGLAILPIVAGSFLFSHRGEHWELMLVLVMAVSCMGHAIKQLGTKHVGQRSGLSSAITGMMLFSALAAATAGLANHELHWPGAAAVAWTLGGAVLGSMIGMSLLYGAFIRVGIARGAPFDAMRPLATAVIGMALLGYRPTLFQCLGGALILAGSMLLAWLMVRVAAKKASQAEGMEAV